MAFFIVWVVFIPLQQKNNLNHIKKYVEIKIFTMPSEDTNILEFNEYQKSDKAPFIIYADLEYTLHKKWSFPLRIFSVNVTKSTENCRFGNISWRNP